jgi:hypothetical protein
LELSTLADWQTEIGWSFPPWRIRQPISVGASHFGGSVSRFRLALSTLADWQTEFGWSFPLWRIRQPEAFFMSSDAESYANQYVESFYLKYHRKPSNPAYSSFEKL